jgi:ATP-binding cassette subfamily B protein
MARTTKVRETLPSAWRLMTYFWPEVRKHRALMTGSLLALFGEIFFRLLEPWPLKFIFDRIVHGSEKYTLPGPFASMGDMGLLVSCAVAVIVFAVCRAMLSFQSVVGFAKLGNSVLARIRSRLYRHVQYLSLSFHTKSRTGDLVVRVINDVGMLQEVAVTALLPTLAKILIVIGMFGLMLYLNWKLALIAVSLWPLYLLRSIKLTRKIRDLAKKQRERQGAMAATAAESLGAIRTVQALSLEGTFADAFSKANDQNVKQDVKGKRLAAALGRWVNVLTAASTALVLGYGGHLVLKGDMTGGDLVLFLTYLRYVYSPVQDLSKYTGRMAKASAAGERVIELLEKVPDVGDLPNAVPAPALKGHVRFEDVTFGYEKDRHHITGVTLDVPAGTHIAIVGPSGAGKSTLVSLLLRLYQPNTGRVMIDGRDVREYQVESVRSQISVVLQDNLLFSGTVRGNIVHGAADATDEQIEAAARLANAHGFIKSLPAGYDSPVGERGVTLSHGQRQRIAIARAAIRQAPILILDEPTTGLDAVSEAAVVEALARVYKGRTTFLVTHNLAQAAAADVILYVEQGKIIERGTHAELMERNGKYAAAYQLQTSSNQEEKKEHARV